MIILPRNLGLPLGYLQFLDFAVFAFSSHHRLARWTCVSMVSSSILERSPRLVLGWMTVFGRANYLTTGYITKPPGQLSFLISTGQEMSTSQSAVMLCDWGIKAGMAYSTCRQTCGWQVKLFDASLTCAISERLRDESLEIKRYANRILILIPILIPTPVSMVLSS